MVLFQEFGYIARRFDSMYRTGQYFFLQKDSKQERKEERKKGRRNEGREGKERKGKEGKGREGKGKDIEGKERTINKERERRREEKKGTERKKGRKESREKGRKEGRKGSPAQELCTSSSLLSVLSGEAKPPASFQMLNQLLLQGSYGFAPEARVCVF